MKWRFTHKELTLLLGILVAAIIIVTLWMRPFSRESGDVSEEQPQANGKPAAVVIVGKTYLLVKDLLK